jgi:hypothetical protein
VERIGVLGNVEVFLDVVVHSPQVRLARLRAVD